MPHPETDDFTPQSTNWDEHKLPPGAYGPDPAADPRPPHPSVHPHWIILGLLFMATLLTLSPWFNNFYPTLRFYLVLLLAFCFWLTGSVWLTFRSICRGQGPSEWRTWAPPGPFLGFVSALLLFLITGTSFLCFLAAHCD